MNQAEVAKLMSQLRIAVSPRHRIMKNRDGPEGRLLKLRKTVTALFKYERLEMHYNRADEARGYAERLLSDAIRNGDKHKPTMEMADFWLLDKTVVHKLFKVLCPRFEDSTSAATRMFKAPREYPCVDPNKKFRKRSILELKGNPYPPVVPDMSFRNRNLIHNVLLDEAKRDFNREKAKLMAEEAKNNEETLTKQPVVELTEKQ